MRTVVLFRHARAPLAGRPDLHFVTLYEGPDERTGMLSIAPRSLTQAPDDAPLPAVIQAAWKDLGGRRATRRRRPPLASGRRKPI